MQNVEEKKPKIEYPTQWEYRLIGRDRERLIALIKDVIKQEYQIQDGQQSSGGKFVSVVVHTLVQSENERNEIFAKLQQNQDVNFVF